MLLLQNGQIVNPNTKDCLFTDVLVDQGIIQKIGKMQEIDISKDFQIIDCTGCVIGPGLVDVHVHFRDPGFTYKEDIVSGAKAAAKGGFTSVILMANTKPVVDNEETLKYVIDKGKETGIHVYTCASITKEMQGKELNNMASLKEAGAVGFTDDGVPIRDVDMVTSAMKKSAILHSPLSFHEEDPAYITNNGVNKGKASEYYHIGGSDRKAEITMVARDLELAVQTGALVNIQHISSAEAVDLVRQAKKKSPYIHAEATPHHFSLTEEETIQKGTLAKMNPPLRREEDRQAIIKGLQDGTIDLIATDHAPHSVEEKKKPITEAPSGIIGLETALSLGIMNLVDQKYLTMAQLFEKMSYNPANLYSLPAGIIKEGAAADLVVINLEESYVADSFVSKSQNSPFLGATMKGKVLYTICDGVVVYKA